MPAAPAKMIASTSWPKLRLGCLPESFAITESTPLDALFGHSAKRIDDGNDVRRWIIQTDQAQNLLDLFVRHQLDAGARLHNRELGYPESSRFLRHHFDNLRPHLDSDHVASRHVGFSQ